MSALGTKTNPIRILVADNWGKGADPTLKAEFPNIKFETYVETTSTHPHGHMVAECICRMLPEDTYATIVFLPYLTLQDRPEYNWLNVIKSERDSGRPFHVANCSFGAHHEDKDWLRESMGRAWDEPHELKAAADKIGNTIVLFAAGNQDSSKRNKPDMDNDINYPQKPLSVLENLFIIGACDKSGIPSTFSSDGEEVWAMYLGEGVRVFDPTKQKFVSVNGTSFASPHAAGDIATSMLTGHIVTKEWYLYYVLHHSWLAKDWARGERHRKAGFGCMLPVMYRVPFFSKMYTLSTPRHKPAYMDFLELS